ncbi:hypothetical protein, partial [Streptomyces beihaiensis]
AAAVAAVGAPGAQAAAPGPSDPVVSPEAFDGASHAADSARTSTQDAQWANRAHWKGEKKPESVNNVGDAVHQVDKTGGQLLKSLGR